MEEFQPNSQDSISVEAEWKRVDKLLESKEDASWSMAALEAFKIFYQVLSEVSFGETTEDKIHNAGELFKDIKAVLSAEKVCRHILEEVGHRVTKTDATKATSALLQGILDMIGRDWQERGWFDRWLTSLNYFWGTHPRLLAGGLATILGLFALTWFGTKTAVGQWLVGLWVGFTEFILGSPYLAGGILVAMVISALLGLTFSGRHRRH
jgi:hypothetical protein